MNNLSHTNKRKLALGYSSQASRSLAEHLALILPLEIDNKAPCQLVVSEHNLSLKLEGHTPISLSFIQEQPYQNISRAGLIRACKPRHGLHVIDATAGWGHDAMQLARYGAKVTMVERHPIMALLLKYALEEYYRYSPEVPLSQVALCEADAFNYLKALSAEDYPDIIYLDPMHPTRKKSALVKKKMQILQQLIFDTVNFEPRLISDGLEETRELICLAREKTKDSVVVKWPQRLPPLVPPHSSIPGKTIRFDRYKKTS